MQPINFKSAKFIKSCAKIEQLPSDQGFEIAFCGRSNVGKSSFLNGLTEQKKLAKTSSTPGKTREINVFKISELLRLCDLPGYGYAKVSRAIQSAWIETLEQYFMHRKSLLALVIIMDARHPLTDLDWQMLRMAHNGHRRVMILINKEDKIKKSGKNHLFAQINKQLEDAKISVSTHLISATNKTGIQGVAQELTQWYHAEKEKGLYSI